MGTTTLSKDKLINICFIAITCIVFLTTLDLIYGFAKQSVIALICSSLSGLIVFIGAYIKKEIKLRKASIRLWILFIVILIIEYCQYSDIICA